MYNHYAPARPAPTYREEYSSSLRTDSRRPPRSYYDSVSFPERYSHEHSDLWSGSGTWAESEPSAWTERHPSQYPPFEDNSPRSRRDVHPDRGYESSENWRNTRDVSTFGSSLDDRSRDWPANTRALQERSPQYSREPYPASHYSGHDHQDVPIEYRESYPPSQSPSSRASRYDQYQHPYLDQAPNWSVHSPPGSRVGCAEPRRERSFTYPTRPSPRSDNRNYSAHERSLNTSATNSTSPRFRNFVPRPPGRTSQDFYEVQTEFRRPSPTASGNSGRHLAQPRSSSHSPGFKRSHLETSMPNGSSLRLDTTDGVEPISSGDRFQKQQCVSIRSPVQPHPEDHSPKHVSTSLQPNRYDSITRSPVLSPKYLTSPPEEPIPTFLSPPTEKPVYCESEVMNVDSTSVLNVPKQRAEDEPSLGKESNSRNDQNEAQSQQPLISIVINTASIESTDHVHPASPVTVAAPSMDTSQNATDSNIETHPDIPVIVNQGAPPLPPSGQDEISFRDALKRVVVARLRFDRQTREEVVRPVLVTNQILAEPPRPSESEGLVKSASAVVQEVVEDPRRESLDKSYETSKPSLEARFAQRQVDLNEKVRRLREEYLTLQERWLVHCAKLDEVAKAGALEEAAATAGRTTRRSTTTLGDAVRSDLEMEQIIASLGNEELTDATHLGAKNAAVIPDMISVTQGQVDYLYDDTNNEVDDPATFYAPRTGYNDWTEEEQRIFLEKYAAYPKQFGIIASFLPEKTAAQCVTYYYLHKTKHIDFRKVVSRLATGRRRRGGRRAAADKKRGNALLVDILKRDAEVSREHTPVTTAGRRTKPVVATSAEAKKINVSRRNTNAEETPTPGSTPDPEAEPRKKRRRVVTARAQAALEQEATLDELEEQEAKAARRGRRGRKPKAVGIASADSPATPSEEYPFFPGVRFIDQTETVGRRKAQQAAGIWSEEEKAQFYPLLAQIGEDFKRIASLMPTKTTAEVSAFYKLHQAELNRLAANIPARSALYDGATPMFPGSRMMTPSSSAPTPPEGAQMNYNTASLETRARINPMVHLHGEPSNYQFSSSTSETMQVSYDQPGAPPNVSRYPSYEPQGMPMGHNHIVNPSPFAQSGPLTTMFPSTFPYTNLSPSNFTSGSRPPPAYAHHPSWGTSPNDMSTYRG